MTATDQVAERTYTAEEVHSLAGASYRQLLFWLETGRLTDPRPEDERGSGYPLTFTQADLDIVRLVVQLLRIGFVLDRAFVIASSLVTDDEFRVMFADIFELKITVRDTAAGQPTSEEPA